MQQLAEPTLISLSSLVTKGPPPHQLQGILDPQAACFAAFVAQGIRGRELSDLADGVDPVFHVRGLSNHAVKSTTKGCVVLGDVNEATHLYARACPRMGAQLFVKVGHAHMVGGSARLLPASLTSTSSTTT